MGRAFRAERLPTAIRQVRSNPDDVVSRRRAPAQPSTVGHDDVRRAASGGWRVNASGTGSLMPPSVRRQASQSQTIA